MLPHTHRRSLAILNTLSRRAAARNSRGFSAAAAAAATDTTTPPKPEFNEDSVLKKTKRSLRILTTLAVLFGYKTICQCYRG